MFNFNAVASILINEGAAILVNDEDELIRNTRIILKDESKAARLGGKAKEVVSKNRGAAGRDIEAIALVIGK